jgi:hypothetical protein
VLVLVLAVVVAIAIVPVTGGSFARLAQLQVARPWMPWLGLGVQIVLELDVVPRDRYDDVGLALLLASYVLVVGFCLSNLRLTGLGVVAVGIGMNAFVIALNSGMPYRAPEGEKLETTVKHRPERSGDVLPALGDTIVLPSPADASISFGDLVLAVGLVDVAFHASRRTRRERRDLRGGAGSGVDGGTGRDADDAVEHRQHADVVDVAGA